jgi:hypothetical protein
VTASAMTATAETATAHATVLTTRLERPARARLLLKRPARARLLLERPARARLLLKRPAQTRLLQGRPAQTRLLQERPRLERAERLEVLPCLLRITQHTLPQTPREDTLAATARVPQNPPQFLVRITQKSPRHLAAREVRLNLKDQTHAGSGPANRDASGIMSVHHQDTTHLLKTPQRDPRRDPRKVRRGARRRTRRVLTPRSPQALGARVAARAQNTRQSQHLTQDRRLNPRREAARVHRHPRLLKVRRVENPVIRVLHPESRVVRVLNPENPVARVLHLENPAARVLGARVAARVQNTLNPRREAARVHRSIHRHLRLLKVRREENPVVRVLHPENPAVRVLHPENPVVRVLIRNQVRRKANQAAEGTSQDDATEYRALNFTCVFGTTHWRLLVSSTVRVLNHTLFAGQETQLYGPDQWCSLNHFMWHVLYLLTLHRRLNLFRT